MGKYALINRMAVDLEALLSLSHECRPELCRTAHCCCASYDVEISRQERCRILEILPTAARFSTALEAGKNPDEIFRDIGHSEYLIETDERDYCLLAYFGPVGQTFCALHAAALALNLPPSQVKPNCCSLWPLALEDGPIPILTIHADAFSFPCNQKRSKEARTLDPGVAAILESLGNHQFVDKIHKACQKMLA